jgi:plasmid stabilization system protein ParE
MDRKVVWTDAAVDDLETAAEYISKDSPSYAAAFVLQSLESAKSLSDLAEREGAG